MNLVEKFESQMIHITAVVYGKLNEDKIRELLQSADLSKIAIKTCSNFEEWLETLSDESCPGLADECVHWIRSWGNGGGDFSTENCITAGIYEDKSNVPKVLAEVIYNGVADYSKTPFEASCLTMLLMDECLKELGVAQ